MCGGDNGRDHRVRECRVVLYDKELCSLLIYHIFRIGACTLTRAAGAKECDREDEGEQGEIESCFHIGILSFTGVLRARNIYCFYSILNFTLCQ